MKRFLSHLGLISLMMLCLSCEKEQKIEEEEFIPNSCSAELFYENGQIGFRVLKAEGSMDIAASLEFEFQMEGKTEFLDYDIVTQVTTEKSKEYTASKNSHPSDRVHIASGEVMNIIDVKDLISAIEMNSDTQYVMKDDKLDISFVHAYTTQIDIAGKATFYRTKDQVFKDQLAAVTSDNPGAATRLYDPVDCKLTMSLNANLFFINGELYPDKTPGVSVVFDNQIVNSISK